MLLLAFLACAASPGCVCTTPISALMWPSPQRVSQVSLHLSLIRVYVAAVRSKLYQR